VHSEQLRGDGLIDEMLWLRSAVPDPHAHQLGWYHPGLWPGLPEATSPQLVPGCVAYRSVLRPPAASAASGHDASD